MQCSVATEIRFQTWKPGVSSDRKPLKYDTQTVIRKVSDETENLADSRRGDTSPTIPRRQDDNLTDYEYRKWIHSTFKPAEPKSLCGLPLRPYDYMDVEARVPEHLRSDPLKALTDDPHALNLALAGDCMQLYLYRLMERTIRRERPSSSLWRQTFDPSEFRACLKNDDAGAKALSWLLNSANHDSIESTFGIKLIQATALCLVGEGRTDVWWDLLKIQHAPREMEDKSIMNQKYRVVRWFNAWLTALLEARAFWTTEQNRLNEPLAMFLEVIRLNREERTDGTRIPLPGAFHWIGSKLPWFDTRGINVEAWDAFADFQLRFLSTDPLEARYRHALFQLNHPVNRSADPLLACLRRAGSDKGQMETITRMPKGLFHLLVKKLMQYCYESGRMNDVRWTLDFSHLARREQGELDVGEVREHNGWAQRRVGRAATPKEIADGLPVDARGRLIPIHFQGTAEDVRMGFEFASKVRRRSDITHTHVSATDTI